jgi:TolA-binding protein
LQEHLAARNVHLGLERYRDSLAKGFFETVIEQSRQVLAKGETKPPADVALYALGETYAQQDYEGRDFALSRQYFQKLIENFPDSPLAPEAKTFVGIFEYLEAKEEVITSKEKEIAELKETTLARKHDPVIMAHRIGIDRDFEGAVQRNLQILKQMGKKSPADVALYNLGLIFAHIDNPFKDYKKSQAYFSLLIKEFPRSSLVDETRVWLGLFEVIEKMQQIDIDIEQQKKQLGR